MKNTVKNEKTQEIGKHSVSKRFHFRFDNCFHTKYFNFNFFITPLTIELVKDYRPMADDNRPIADCEKTCRLIGFPDVLPMIGSPLPANGLRVNH